MILGPLMGVYVHFPIWPPRYNTVIVADVLVHDKSKILIFLDYLLSMFYMKGTCLRIVGHLRYLLLSINPAIPLLKNMISKH